MGKNILKLNTKGFEEYAEKLEKLGADLKPIFTDALEQVADTITEDTIDAMSYRHLPRLGKYATGQTEGTIIAPKVTWSGTIGEVPLGFDFSKPGAGGYLITGTPRMNPNKALNRIYKSKKYMSDIKKDMTDIFQDEIDKRMGG